MSKVILCLLLLTLFSTNLNAQNSAAPLLLREMLDFQSPPPKKVKEEESKRPASFYDKNPPADDAPIEDLLDYWSTKLNGTYVGDSKMPVASVKTSLRLIDAVDAEPFKFNSFLKVLPLEKEVAERIKRLYDMKQTSEDVSDYWRNEVKEWLKFKSDFYIDEVFDEAQKAKDHAKYASVNYSNQLKALAKYDWESAQQLLGKLERDEANPGTAVLAKRLFYERAIQEKNEADAEKYRSELKSIIEDKKASGKARDAAFDALTENAAWQGFDDWYISLLADETLLELSVSENSVNTPLISVTDKNPDKWIPILTKLVGNKNPNVHNAAVGGLLEIVKDKANRDAAVPLLPWLTNPAWAKDTGDDRSSFIQKLDKIDLPESIPGLLWILETDEDLRDSTISALTKYKDQQAIPLMKRVLFETPDEQTRQYYTNALFALEGFSDAEMLEAIQFYVEAILTPEGYGKVEERDETDDEKPLPLQISIGKFLARQKTPAENFVRAFFEHLREFQKTKPAVAKKLLEISNEWHGEAVDAEILRRVADARADSDTILTVLARRRELRENSPLETSQLTAKSGLPRAVGACVLEDESQAAGLASRDEPETQIAILACARMIRLKLPVREVGTLLDSPDKLLALAAERYLESEDSREARDLVLAKHKGEALILGARASFNPAKKTFTENYSSNHSLPDTPLEKLFRSVNGSYLMPDNYYPFNTEYDKDEEKLRKEILENKDLQEIYAAGNDFLRVFKDKAVYTWHDGESVYHEKVLTKEELEDFHKYLVENKVDEMAFGFSCAHNCGPSQFVMLARDGGRRVFAYDGWGSQFWMSAMFMKLQTEDARLHFWLEKYVPGLEVLVAEKRFIPQIIWKSGDNLRVLIADQTKENEIREETSKQDEIDRKNEDLTYDERSSRSWKRGADRKHEHYSWFEFKNGKLAEGANEPAEVPFLRDKSLFPPVREPECEEDNPQARNLNYQICAGSYTSGGLWRINRLESVKIRDGIFKYPILTPDGKWIIVTKTESNWDAPLTVVRVNAQTGKESKINLAPAKNLRAISYVEAHKKILLSSSDDYFANVNPKYYLLDVESGAVTPVKGVFAPLRNASRPLQPTGKPNEFWAAVYDGEATDIGIYDAKLFKFKSLVKLPQIQIRSSGLWVEEKEGKIYFIYSTGFLQDGYLLSVPLPLAQVIKTIHGQQ